MPLPLLRTQEIGSANPLINALNNMNALQQGFSENQLKNVQAQYAPLSAQAEAASKLAYANLMGPQFLSKLMGNSDILANMNPDQRNQALKLLYQAGTGQGSGNALLSNDMNDNSPSTPFSKLVNTIKHGLGLNTISQNRPTNQLLENPNLSMIDRNRISSMSPGYSYDENGNNVKASPDEIKNIANRSSYENKDTFFENVGRAKGIEEEGKEAGKIRAKNINDLSDLSFNAQTKQATIDNISKIISSPVFEKMRQTPILGHHELDYYQRYGTPEQQNIVGQLVTLSGNIIRDAAQDFKGAFRKGEQQLIQNMKINPGDTFDAARGKMEQLSYLNQLIKKRSELTAKYMQKNHMSKLEAEELADKNVNGDLIRSNVHNQLNPKPTEEDINFMAQKYKTTPDEIRNRLRSKGLL